MNNSHIKALFDKGKGFVDFCWGQNIFSLKKNTCTHTHTHTWFDLNFVGGHVES